MKALVIGATSEAGKAAIEALRSYDSSAYIYGTTSKPDGKVEAADHAITGIDLTDSEMVAKLKDQLNANSDITYLCFTPAYGPIGFPVRASTEAQVQEALDFSFHPMLKIKEQLNPALTIGFSAFYWLRHTLRAYGAMAYAKLQLEKTCFENPQEFRAVRAGTFKSQATRGIALLINRSLKNSEHPEFQKMQEEYKASGMKFSDYFFKLAFDEEKRAHEEGEFEEKFSMPHQATTRESIKAGVAKILREDAGPVVNTIGNWIWVSKEPPQLPEDFALKKFSF